MTPRPSDYSKTPVLPGPLGKTDENGITRELFEAFRLGSLTCGIVHHFSADDVCEHDDLWTGPILARFAESIEALDDAQDWDLVALADLAKAAQAAEPLIRYRTPGGRFGFPGLWNTPTELINLGVEEIEL